ncbi:deoxyguanosinetriphosphate triphosphohydrolase [Catalinimonas sp. 4WD22]|uniref:deoxyguanosinetriphosphate triphosphohydrolase n=1 Tax=Catalinimonas locisalis TaxID=3133978 RepID=UPI00310138B2
MHWNHLFSPIRLGVEDRPTYTDMIRNPYQQDYDRLIFSSPFRRLQNKTQVFPLPGSVFVHNRLTHSLEVACVGRSLGNIIGHRIADEHPDETPQFAHFYRNEMGSVISAACIAHDIGNPPFGHSGEKAISTYFTNLEGEIRSLLEDSFNSSQWNDLTNFEGNANGLRLLTHQFKERSYGGLRLTYTTLAAMVKYPCESAIGLNKSRKSRSKFGFFHSEIETFSKIAAELKIKATSDNPKAYVRHPFVYLVEAADDICYQVIDWEDAHRLKIISTEEAQNQLLQFFADLTTDKYQRIKSNALKIQDLNERMGYLRAVAINSLVNECADIFWQNRDAILEGTYEKSLLDELSGSLGEAFQALQSKSIDRIYNYRPVVEIELAGYKILGGLLEEFVPAVLNMKGHQSKKLLRLLPLQFQPEENTCLYEKVQSVVDFVSGMTDLYAVDLFRHIKGISLPELR